MYLLQKQHRMLAQRILRLYYLYIKNLRAGAVVLLTAVKVKTLNCARHVLGSSAR